MVLLTYNHRQVVEDAIRTALHQTLDDYELLISDDSSTDGTWEYVQGVAVADRRVRAIRTPRNLGMAGNANFAVSHVQRPYVALLHHDDIYRQDLLERWLDVLEQYPDVAFVFNGYWWPDTGQVYIHGCPEWMPGREFLRRKLLARWGCPVRGTTMIRRSCWEAVGGMREEFGLLADVDLWMRLAARCAVGYVAEPLIGIRHRRPEGYAEDYVVFSWRRNRILYDIHAANLQDYYSGTVLRGTLARIRFRCRVSVDVVKWLGYAAVKNKPDILRCAEEGRNIYELPPVEWLRRALMYLPPATKHS